MSLCDHCGEPVWADPDGGWICNDPSLQVEHDCTTDYEGTKP